MTEDKTLCSEDLKESILNSPAKFLLVYNVHSLEVLCRALWEKDINDLNSSETCMLQD